MINQKKYILVALIFFASTSCRGQDLFDKIINKVTKSLMDTTFIQEKLSIKDSLFTRLSLNINAVCRVTLQNGTTVEGFIDFANGGAVNGFYFKGGKSNCHLANSVFRLDMRFKKWIRKSKQEYQIIWDESSFFSCDTVNFVYVQEIFFMDWNGNSRIGSPQTITLNKSTDKYILNISQKSDNEIEYRLMDTLSVYPALSPDSYIRTAHISNPTQILVSEIIEFEFLEKPNQHWIKMIESNRIEAKRHQIAQDEWRVSSLSNWYHDIRQDNELTEFIQKCITMQHDAHGGN